MSILMLYIVQSALLARQPRWTLEPVLDFIYMYAHACIGTLYKRHRALVDMVKIDSHYFNEILVFHAKFCTLQ